MASHSWRYSSTSMRSDGIARLQHAEAARRSSFSAQRTQPLGAPPEIGGNERAEVHRDVLLACSPGAAPGQDSVPRAALLSIHARVEVADPQGTPLLIVE
jgi:hypothetical protein